MIIKIGDARATLGPNESVEKIERKEISFAVLRVR